MEAKVSTTAPAETAPATTMGPVQTRIGVDVGGTFTDLVALVDGQLSTTKVPSTADDQSIGMLDALRASGVDLGSGVSLAHGMTVATNALLERRGARAALVTTEGFRDLLEICRQDRPSMYDLTEDRPPPLVPRELRFSVRERMGPDGVVEALDEESLASVVSALQEADVEAVAVCLLFSFLHPEHERRVGEALRRALPQVHVSLSSEVLAEFREFERCSTVAADAYLAPRLSSYLLGLAQLLAEAGIPAPFVMQSSGGVTEIEGAVARPAACILSGPAGGVIGAAYTAKESGYDNLLTFDMGGTSTDVAPVVGGRVQITTESIVAGIPIKFPMVDVHTVSAGGGSIAWVDEGGALRVGPRSAGANPGPASYGRGGSEPTVTDADLLLGYLSGDAVLGGEVVLRAELAEQALASLASKLQMTALELAHGIVEVADAEMVRALRVISVERGLHPREFVLVAYGGAGPLHACSLAEELRMETVLVPRACGVLSALGLTVSDLRRDYVRPFFAALPLAAPARAEAAFAEMEACAGRELQEPALERLADVRYRGQSFELTVPADDLHALADEFHLVHERRYGFRMEGEGIELVNVRLVATLGVRRPRLHEPAPAVQLPERHRSANFAGDWVDVDVLDRERLGVGSRVVGPAIVEFREATCLVRSGWGGSVDESGSLVLRRQ
ncbi:MAG: hydantoinase/oxoprolinase family protein [Gaiellaceae bacterium MAG52_C11]|nr:hydantoinase/oxoprolinase family protein [Candidatus Gaiellasilicea maunaloa]